MATAALGLALTPAAFVRQHKVASQKKSVTLKAFAMAAEVETTEEPTST